MTEQIRSNEIEFNRPKKFSALDELGSGACGQTLLLRDEDMGIEVVAKKYKPVVSKSMHPDQFAELIDRFRDEARILFQLNHPNIVRVYNYYDYRDSDTSYILMEYVSGDDIVADVKREPLSFDFVFEKVVNGFEHLEGKGILHRDIRPSNILVSTEGEPKIIDFGFGKFMDTDVSIDEKSISLNWWCKTPPEFNQSIYDSQTEVYFVGKLFEHILTEAGLCETKFKSVIERMCLRSRTTRFTSFRDIHGLLNQEQFEGIQFSDEEVEIYRSFAHKLYSLFGNLGSGASIEQDASVISNKLERLYQTVQLEAYIPDPLKLCEVFLTGEYTYYRRKQFEVKTLDGFRKLLGSLSGGKREIVIANLTSRLEALPKNVQSFTQDLDDEIPF